MQFITVLSQYHSHSHSLVRIELFLGLGFYSESILQRQDRGDEIQQTNAMDDLG
ncbi:hypothetical protein R6Q59_035328 [Mikania micrantha]